MKAHVQIRRAERPWTRAGFRPPKVGDGCPPVTVANSAPILPFVAEHTRLSEAEVDPAAQPDAVSRPHDRLHGRGSPTWVACRSSSTRRGFLRRGPRRRGGPVGIGGQPDRSLLGGDARAGGASIGRTPVPALRSRRKIPRPRCWPGTRCGSCPVGPGGV
ncbi:MAG: hypothetical protein MZV64_16980 [Ignavibacteriales bacterium]|nr:hypothetical protein [Ignavibacteriales bacterium]